MHKTQVQMDRRPQHKASHAEPHRRESGSTLERIGTGDHFLNRTPAARTLRETINKWDLLKLKNFCKAKDTVNKTKQQPTAWEKIFTNSISPEPSLNPSSLRCFDLFCLSEFGVSTLSLPSAGSHPCFFLLKLKPL